MENIQRSKYIKTCLYAAIPILLFFGLDDILGKRYIEGGSTLAVALVFGMLLWLQLQGRNILVRRLGTPVFFVFLLYLVMSGSAGGAAILWTYTFPLLCFFILDRKEGLVWSISFFVLLASFMVLQAPLGVSYFEQPFIMRFLVSFFIVSLMSYAYAAVRDRLYEEKQKEVEEKNTLLKEVHHRIKNNLTVVQGLLSLQCGTIFNEESRSALIESESRVRSMALLHEALYSGEPSSRVEMSVYLQRVIGHISDTYAIDSSGIRINVEVPETWFDVELAMPCGLVANELITNAIKNIKPGAVKSEITVSLRQEQEGEFLLSVKDNGKGFADDFDISSDKTFGMRIVNSFASQIYGTLGVNLPEGGGTEVTLSFKIPAP